MKLISDIINELVDNEISVNTPLLKTKVLASRLQNATLLDWVNDELTGYDDFKPLPDYRVFGGHVKGDYLNGRIQCTNFSIPLGGLNDEFIREIRDVKLRYSVVSLEKLSKDTKSKTLEFLFPFETTQYLGQLLIKMGNPHLHLISCKTIVSTNVVNEALSAVRNKLLDFMLKMELEFGHVTEIEDLKSKKAEIATIMSQTIINTSGDGNVFSTGANSPINATISINKGNKQQLEKHLLDAGVSQPDITELVQIVDVEEPAIESNRFGPQVNGWVQRMLGKVLDGSWNIGIGAAGTLLAEAINNYYGLL